VVSSRAVLAALESQSPAIAAILAAHDHARREVTSVRMMGVVNVTPDSFSDGGRFAEAARAIEHGLRLAGEGAEVIDVGGESTRPRAEPVDADTERERVVPVVAGLAQRTRVAISVDTTKASVAEAALEAGASIVNDVSAGRFDARMLELVAARRAGFVAMHMQGTPHEMQIDPRYDDVVTEVAEFLRARVRACLEAGIERSKIWIDPGIGFGKRLEHNLELIARLRELRSLGLPICLGVSRKSFIAAIENRARESSDTDADSRAGESSASDAELRIGGTAAAVAIGVVNGAEILRVHDASTMLQAARVALALSRRIRAPEPS
jgi:dihydropteroate synthase